MNGFCCLWAKSFTCLCKEKLAEHQLSICMHNNYGSEESEDHENFTDKQCMVNERSLQTPNLEYILIFEGFI